MIDVALVGFGAIGRSLARTLAAEPTQARVVAVLVRPGGSVAGCGELPPGARVVDRVDALIAAQPHVVVECAGHAALRDLGPGILAAGKDLLVASVGALADADTENNLRRAAAQGGARVLLATGALGALDILATARLVGLTRVSYVGCKAPRAWANTPAAALIDPAKLDRAQMLFEGNARDAALRFPQNANVAAAVALAGVGFEDTRVELVADPAATGNRHSIKAEGAFGAFEFSVTGRVLPDNPKTSMLAPFSLAKALLSRRACVAFA